MKSQKLKINVMLKNRSYRRKYIASFTLSFIMSLMTIYGCGKDSEPTSNVIPPGQTVKEVNILDFKNATNSDHEMIQRAIDYASEKQINTVWVPKGNYLIDAAGVNGAKGIKLRSGIVLKLDNDAVLKAIPNNAPNYSIIRVHDVEGVKITGGTILGEKKEHTGTGGEWGMGIDIQSSSNVEILNVQINDCWGDGIYIGGARISKNIIVDNVTCDGNRRQGISIVYADKVVVKNSIMSNTRGTAPQAGIDVEPNVGQYVSNIKVFDCKFLNNTGPGFFVFAGTGKVSDVMIRDCLSEGNSHAGINLNGSNEILPVKNLKNVKIANVILKNNPLIGLSVREVDGLILDTLQVFDCLDRGVRIRFSKNLTIDSLKVQNVKNEAFLIEGIDEAFFNRTLSVGLSESSSRSIGWSVINSQGLEIKNAIVDGGISGLYFENVRNSKVLNSAFENIRESPVLLTESHDNRIEKNYFKNNCIAVNNQNNQISITSSSTGNSIAENKSFNSSHSNKPKYFIWFDISTLNNISKENTIEAGSYVVEPVKDDTNGNNQVI